MILATTDPPRLTSLVPLSPSCASGFAFRLHGVFHNTPSPMAGLVAIGGISISFFVGGDVFMLEMGQKNKKRRNLCCFRFVEKTNGEVALLGMW